MDAKRIGIVPELVCNGIGNVVASSSTVFKQFAQNFLSKRFFPSYSKEKFVALTKNIHTFLSLRIFQGVAAHRDRGNFDPSSYRYCA